MGPFFDNRAELIWKVPAHERLVNIGIRRSANSFKMKLVAKLETSVCFRITRLMINQIKSQKRGTHQKEEKEKTRMLWLWWKVCHNWVVYHKIQMHSFLKVESLGETRCRKSWHQFKGYDSQSLRYVMRVSGKRKGHRWENKCQKFSSAKSLRHVILRTAPMKRLNDSSDVPEARPGILREIYTSSKKIQGCILLSRGRMGTPGCVNRRAGGKIVWSWFRSKYAYGQQERPWLCWVGDHEDIEESDDGDDGQRRGANQRGSDGICQAIGLIRQSYASWRNSRSSFLGGNSVRIMGILTTGSAVKKHISSEMARELIAK